jgi:hypothetical protein
MVTGCCVLPLSFLSCSLLRFCCNNGYWMLRSATPFPVLFIVAFLLLQWLLDVAFYHYFSCLVHCCVSVATMVTGCCVLPLRFLSCSLLRFFCNNGYWMLRSASTFPVLFIVASLLQQCCVMRTYIAWLVVPRMLVFSARCELFRVLSLFEV